MIKPAFIFTDGAVLQRDREVPIFGECDTSSLTVSFLDKTVEAHIEDGRFTAILPPMEAKLSGELIFFGDGETLILSDIAVGDVWLCGGQSNMEHPTFVTLYDESDLSTDDGIRLFSVPRRPYKDAHIMGWHFYGIPSEDTPWVKYNESSALGFPAIGAFFAKRLRRDIDIPLGIISCNWGATNAESWTDRDKLLSKPMARFAVDEYDKKFGNIDKAAYHERFMGFQKKLIDHLDTTEDIMKVARERGGAYALRHGFSTMIEEGPYHYKTPGNYRETMLARITPYAICGVLWYQGESNTRADLPFDTKLWFREVMDTMIEDWREAFRAPSLPFYIVQISTFPSVSADATTWHDIRRVHEELAEEKNIYTVVSADVGETDNIHPIDKKPIGERLALAALANEYGKDVSWQGPKIKNVSKESGKYVLTFHNSDGLFAKGDAPAAFFMTLRDGRRLEVAAKLDNDRIIIDGAEDALTIGYCDQNYSLANVYNGCGLPLYPFRVSI